MKILQRISAEIVAETGAQALYEMLVDGARAMMRSDFSSMQMLDPERGELRLLAFRGFTPEAAGTWIWVRSDSPCTCGAALRLQRRVIVPDVEIHDPTIGALDVATYRATGIRAVQSTPLRARDGRIVGMISTHWSRPHEPTEGDLRLLDLLARQAADALERQAAETALRRSEEALRRSEAELRTLAASLERRVFERTADLVEANAQMMGFSYSVSHDLRAPVRAIRGYLDILAEELGGSATPAGFDYIAKISSATDRMDRLISDLLAHTRVARMDLQKSGVRLAGCVEEAIRQLEDTSVHAALTCAVDSGLTVIADPSALVQVIWNLLANAVKFVRPGTPPVVHVHAESRGTRVRLWVEDNGIGIAPRHHERIFKMFERLHHQGDYEGTGLGLALVLNAVERMGGTVGVESEEGAGSRFWIELQKSAPSIDRNIAEGGAGARLPGGAGIPPG